MMNKHIENLSYGLTNLPNLSNLSLDLRNNFNDGRTNRFQLCTQFSFGHFKMCQSLKMDSQTRINQIILLFIIFFKLRMQVSILKMLIKKQIQNRKLNFNKTDL
ncbi:hypothetical protein ABPG72_000414 [Tetrahymena utriculariae]